MEPKGIDELLSGTPDAYPIEDAAPEPEATPEPVAEAPAEAEGQPRGPDGKFASKQTGVEEPAQQEPIAAAPPAADQLPREVYEPLKAVRNENRELKEAIAAMQAQMATFQPQQQPAPPADFWDDPQAFLATQFDQFGQSMMQRFQQQQQMERIDASEAAAKGRYGDYDNAFAAFQKAAMHNPALVQQMTAASDPAEYAYTTGKRALDLEQVGSLDALIAQERAKWEQEVKAAIQPPQSFPATTAADGSVGARTGPAWGGPKPLNELLG